MGALPIFRGKTVQCQTLIDLRPVHNHSFSLTCKSQSNLLHLFSQGGVGATNVCEFLL